ncbi:hypothetical protein [Hyphomonas sp.]|uniref:hypothetical protein n=1 Tax=Hyphomonas sp. TaxID=87 RepID=UPI0025BBA700|nr:hypothetical protein [Hyphomonas sp.]
MSFSRYEPEELLFARERLSDVVNVLEQRVCLQAAKYSKDQLGAPTEELALELALKNTLTVPTIAENEIEVFATEVQVDFQSGYHVGDSGMVRGGSSRSTRPAVEVSLPIKGDTSLLLLRPSTYESSYDSNPPRGKITGSSIVFTLLHTESEGEDNRLRREIDQRRDGIKRYLDWQRIELAGHPASIIAIAIRELEARKVQLASTENVVSKLGYKIKKND